MKRCSNVSGINFPFFRGKKSKLDDFFRRKSNPSIGPFSKAVDVYFGPSKKKPRQGAVIINNAVARGNSGNKLRTNKMLLRQGISVSPKSIKLTEFFTPESNQFLLKNFKSEFEFPVALKRISGKGGIDFYKIADLAGLQKVLTALPRFKVDHMFFEPYFVHDSEFRIHASSHLVGVNINYTYTWSKKVEDDWEIHTESDSRDNGVILYQKKAVKNGTKRTSTGNYDPAHTVFLSRFNFPEGFDEIAKQTVKAVGLLGLDFGCADILFNQSTGEYRICEVNSNPGMSQDKKRPTMPVTAQVYRTALNQIIRKRCAE